MCHEGPLHLVPGLPVDARGTCSLKWLFALLACSERGTLSRSAEYCPQAEQSGPRPSLHDIWELQEGGATALITAV